MFVPADIPGWEWLLEVRETLAGLSRGSICTVQIAVNNTTGHLNTLRPGVHLGYVTQIKSSATSMKPQQSTVQTEEADRISDIKVSQLNADNSGEETEWEPGTHLDEAHCAVDQVSKIRQMLREECSSFSRDENDLR